MDSGVKCIIDFFGSRKCWQHAAVG